MTASASSRISLSRSSAAGFSILTSSAARPPISDRASATSSGRWTNDRPIQSTPWSSAKPRSARSFGVSAGSGTTMSGTLTPLWSLSVPPVTTVATMRSAATSVQERTILPSSISRRVPVTSAANSSRCGRVTRVASPAASSRSRTKVAPAATSARPPAKVPTRSLGPCRSARMVSGRPISPSSARMLAIRPPRVAGAPWLMLTRKASAPATTSARSTSTVADAGPSVARTLTRRPRGVNTDGSLQRRARLAV